MNDDCEGLDCVRAVWDFTVGDVHRFCDRLQIIIDAMERLRARNIASDFVVLIHGPATQFAARNLSGTKFEDGDATAIRPAHAVMEHFAELGGRIEVCGVAMNRCAIAPDNIIACAAIEHNVFVNSVALQNRGYAYMPIL